MKAIVMNDPIAFTKLLVSQGFDLWFTQACYPVSDLKKVGLQLADLRNFDLLHKVRQLVENEYCKGLDLVSDLDPSLIRFIHKIEDRSERKDFSEIRNRGDTTDEEEAKAATAEKTVEEEKKGEPDEEMKEEEKKELEPEEEKKSPEEVKKEQEEKARRKAEKEEKLKSVKEKLQRMKLATIFETWSDDAANSKLDKSLSEE